MTHENGAQIAEPIHGYLQSTSPSASCTLSCGSFSVVFVSRNEWESVSTSSRGLKRQQKLDTLKWKAFYESFLGSKKPPPTKRSRYIQSQFSSTPSPTKPSDILSSWSFSSPSPQNPPLTSVHFQHRSKRSISLSTTEPMITTSRYALYPPFYSALFLRTSGRQKTTLPLSVGGGVPR